ncbi:S41 family peptidase [Romboutsia lituseburensis]|uniref:Peptidase family S41 n=1 Tax=Romboutsia lituseburensis DSM 797 TaxID=1121325 RepID=A0A1G9TAN5_9FIRM|nr:S41 family peptidase [Romboutsia lituseburensis]CEH36170.1 tail specific protease [Romboutsia lituseburensis]SDM44175.1 Peptidase family S41 [Romboutsia lituseburensis DSM 797]
MQIYEYLKFLQIVDGTKAEYVFENDNKEKIKINVNAIKNKEVNYVNLDKTQSKISTKFEGKYDFYWTKQMKEDNVLYFKYNKCLTNQGANIDKQDSANYPDYYDFHNNLLEEINNNNYEKLVIDLRQNRGGAFKLVDLLIHDLKYKINLNSEDIVVITGKETLSAGAILAWRLQNELGATIIGEETGGNVNIFGTEGEFITLPNSKIKVKHPYSFRELKEGYNGGVKPDVQIKQTYKNYIYGIDDCYEYVINVLKK